ncbi:hypothetical protein WJT74_03000 [Sphingomicrobium sp. XHP0239]|uniref:hypothetical protein n=1 Tax=Sphingomicrobium maritimum TaxID=3133972 RepID=UPI0031CC90E0
MLRSLTLGLAILGLSACANEGEIEDGGIVVARDLCPQVAIPAGTGSVTLFSQAGSTSADAIDVTATITNVDPECFEDSASIVTTTGYSVYAQRREAGPARTVLLPVFNTVMRGGEAIVSKRVGQVRVDFAEGAIRAETRGEARVRVDRAAATLPSDVRAELTRRRRSGDVDAAIDPLSRPEIRSAVANATFEQLIGFQLTPEQLQYNATK